MKIIRGYWDCSFCGTKKIDGLVDICPNCGKQKSDDLKYYMGSPDDVVSEEQLKKAGISKEECDGQHKDWVCPYCDQLNNWSAKDCVACGAPREASGKNYGEITEKKKKAPVHLNHVVQQPIPQTSQKKKPPYAYIGLAAFFVLLFTFLLFPIKQVTTVSGFSWNQEVVVEEYQTFEESDWNLPTGARLQDSKTEFYGYEQVLDHMETVTEEKSRQVITGYDTTTSYVDNGNGTFSEVSEQVPVYGTEYYTETREEPVYRDEPIYKTKYYYEIDRWTAIDSYESSGNDHAPYWNEDYILTGKQRDEERSGEYRVEFSTKKKTYEEEIDFAQWSKLEIGDQFEVTKCRLGIEYGRKELQ